MLICKKDLLDADVNVSIRPKGDTNLYTRCEIKNMNSFKFIEKSNCI